MHREWSGGCWTHSIVLPAVQLNMAGLGLGNVGSLLDLFGGGIAQLAGLVLGIFRDIPRAVQLGARLVGRAFGGAVDGVGVCLAEGGAQGAGGGEERHCLRRWQCFISLIA